MKSSSEFSRVGRKNRFYIQKLLKLFNNCCFGYKTRDLKSTQLNNKNLLLACKNGYNLIEL